MAIVGYWSESGCTTAAAYSLASELGLLEPTDLTEHRLDTIRGTCVLLLVPTYDGVAPPCAREAITALKAGGPSSLAGLSYAVCGTGDSTYSDWFNMAAHELDALLATKGAERLASVGSADIQHPQGLAAGIQQWYQVLRRLPAIADRLPSVAGCNDQAEIITDNTVESYRSFELDAEAVQCMTDRVAAAVGQVNTVDGSSVGFLIAASRVICSHEPLKSFGAVQTGAFVVSGITAPTLPGAFMSTNRLLGLGIVAITPLHDVVPLQLADLNATPITPGMRLLAAEMSGGTIRLVYVVVTAVEAHCLRFNADGDTKFEGEKNASSKCLPVLRPDTLKVVAVRLHDPFCATPVGVFLDKLHRRKQLSTALDVDPAMPQLKKRKPKQASSTLPSVSTMPRAALSKAIMQVRPSENQFQEVGASLLDSNGVLMLVMVLFFATAIHVLRQLMQDL